MDDSNGTESTKSMSTKMSTDIVTAASSGFERSVNLQDIHTCRFAMLQRVRFGFREYLAEFLGSIILVMFSDGVGAQFKLSNGDSGSNTTIPFSCATAVFLGYAYSAGISGGHLNPGVSIAAATYRQFPWRKIPGYMFAQGLGGYTGALIVYGTYIQSINNFAGEGVRIATGSDLATGRIFCTFPQPFLNTKGQVTSELVASAFLQLGIFAMTDPHNAPLGDFFPIGL